MVAYGCTFTSNTASINGGAIYSVSYNNTNPCDLTLCNFYTNHAKVGGALWLQEAANITLCQFNGNYADGGNKLGGAIFYGGSVHDKSVTIQGGTFTNNEARSGRGGAIYADKISTSQNTCDITIESITIEGTTYTPDIHDNQANNGGGIGVGEGCVMNFNDGNVYNNTANSNGGGVMIYGNGGTFNMTGGSIGAIINSVGTGNTANKGGGVYVNGGTFNLSDGNVQYNSMSGSDKQGAGIYLASGSVSMTGGKVNNNTGATSGGGVYVAGGTFGLSSTGEIISNSAGAGGGVYQNGGTFNQSGGYIGKQNYANTATSQGGGGLYLNSSTFNLSGGYIAYNTTSAGYGGGVRLEGGTLAMSGGQIVNNSTNNYGGGVYKAAGTLRVTGAPVIKDNTTSSNANDVFLNNATDKYVLIGAAGLQCGAEIGLYNSTTAKVVEAEGANRAANANYAMRNGFFFDDRNSKTIGSSTSSPYYNVNSYELYFVSGSSSAWSQTTQPAGYTESGTTITISTAQGLAYMAYQVNSGNDTYSGKTVQLSADLNLSANEWVPVGFVKECDRDPLHPEGFQGIFDGQGHTISGLTCQNLYDNAGLFGIVRGGTVKNLMIAGTVANASANLGGIVGELIGGSVYNCMSSVTPTGGNYRGALVGKITSGTLKNCYANSDAAACGSGTMTNCYVRKVTGGTAADMGNATNVGSSGSTTGTFTQTVTPYLYNHADNKVGSTPLLTLLNQWVDNQNSPADLSSWTRTMGSPINSDYPILMFDNLSTPMTCVATKSGNSALIYGTSLNTMLGLQYNGAGDNIYFWGTESGITYANRNGDVYFAENAAIIHNSTIEHAHVGITLSNASGTGGHWHMFSPALSDAPLGINYAGNTTQYPYGTGHPSGMPYFRFYPDNNANHGYFPSMDYNWAAANNFTYNAGNTAANTNGNYYNDWDYYCYYEPQYHWINFKRNSNSHWHEDGNHSQITYTNESTMTRGKGYLVATAQPCLLEAKGTLNQGSFTIPVTRNGEYRTGYNFLGNPYQSYLDFDVFADVNKALWGGTKTNASYLILDKDGYTYYAYSGSANQITSPANRYLHPHQGFMIVATNAGNATFNNNMRNITATAPFRDDHIDYPLVNLIATEEDGNRDIVTVELGRPEVGGAFKQYDMHLGKGCIYTHYEDADYAIAFTLPGLSEIGIRFETDEDATYTMTWDMENGEFSYLHLIDNITGSDIDCLTATEYRFTSRTNDYKSRFKLVFEYTGVEEQEDGPSTGSGTFAFMMGDELVVNCGPSTGLGTAGTATLQMFDMMGRLVMQKTVSGTQTTIAMPEMTAGVYVLRLSDNNGSRVQKIVIE